MKTIIINKPGNYSYTLDQEGSELNIMGTFWLKNHDNQSVNLTLIHAAPHTKARVTLKAVVEDSAHLNLNGLIKVNEAGQDTDSYLSEKVLLLSPKATASAIPNLEILANEVKCSHSATIGPIDEEQLFYLMSRGLSKEKATSLLAEGFLKS
jgi:Fe-S cluster assembly protein SufD